MILLNQIFFFTIAVGVIQSILLVAHWALYKTIVRFFSLENQVVILYLKIILGILSVTFVLASYLSFYYSSLPVRVFYNLAADWLGFLYLFLIASIILWLFGRNITCHVPATRDIPTGNGAACRYYTIVLFSIAVLIGIYGLWNANHIQITRLNIKLNNLPAAWQGKTAVWVSDIHLGQVRGKEFSEQITKKINDLNPNVVFIGGDLFDGVAGDYADQAEPFSQIKAPWGTYFITGNHEEFDGADKFIAAAKSADMRVLDDQMIDLSGVQLIGVDYATLLTASLFDRFWNI